MPAQSLVEQANLAYGSANRGEHQVAFVLAQPHHLNEMDTSIMQ